MLISLTHAPSAIPGSHSTVAVGVNQIVAVEGGPQGSVVWLPQGKSYPVLESVEEVMDRCDAALTESGRTKARNERTALREQREKAAAEKLATEEAARARAEAERMEAESQRQRLAAEGAKRRAEEANRAASVFGQHRAAAPAPPQPQPNPHAPAQPGAEQKTQKAAGKSEK